MKKILLSILSIVIIGAITIGALELFSSYKPSENINKNAFVQTRKTLSINASPEKIYNIMSNVNQWPVWHSDVQQPVLNGDFQKGNSFHWKGSGLTIHSTIHTAIPYSKIGWSGKALGAFAIHNWTFVPKDGFTEVVVDESMEGWLVSLMRKKFQTGLEESLQKWLQNLKAEAEK